MKIIIGIIIGWLTVGLLIAGFTTGRQWTDYEIKRVIDLLEKIEKNTHDGCYQGNIPIRDSR